MNRKSALKYNMCVKYCCDVSRCPCDVPRCPCDVSRCPCDVSSCPCDVSRCPCDECNISHLITCGLISPEVSEQQHHHHHHHDHSEAEHQQPPDHNSNDVTCNDDTSQLSASRYDSLRSYYVNIKPPSVPSSDSGSSSQSPIILDRCRFFGENFEYVILIVCF